MSEPSILDIEWSSYINLCHVAISKGDFEAALQCAEKCCCLKSNADSFFHIGIVLCHMGRFKDAIDIYQKAILMEPDKSIYKYNLAFALLSDKQLQEGFHFYDLRLTVKSEDSFRIGGVSPQQTQFLARFPKIWDGKEYYKHLYVFAEQGIGDTIQFLRYLPFLIEDAKKINAKITFEAQRTLAPLIKNIFPEITIIPRDGEGFPVPTKHDAAFSIYSMGRLYWNREVKIPYLQKNVPPVANDKIKVGLCWAGHPGFPNDHIRSLKLSDFKRLPLEGIEYYSFQMGVMKRNWINNENVDLLDYEFPFTADATENIFDWRDTMKLINEMDLIISADTSVAHFAGAMGKQVWLLNHNPPDWRWCPDVSEDDSKYSYWYPTMRIFTQKKYRDWSMVIDHVAKELIEIKN